MGVFDAYHDALFTQYEVELQLTHRLMGGVPKDPKVIEAWLRTKTGVSDADEIKRMMIRTLQEQGVDVTAAMSYEEILLASEGLAAIKNTNGFKRIEGLGLVLESRCVKSLLKEATHVLFAGGKWGQRAKGSEDGAYPGKAPRSLVAETVFVTPHYIPLGREEPDGLELFIGHVTGPKGPQSNLTHYEYVERPLLKFQLHIALDRVPKDAWPYLFVYGQENGIGALRSQSKGTFEVVKFELVNQSKPIKV